MKNSILAIFLVIGVHLATAEEFASSSQDQNSLIEEFRYTALSAPHLEYGSGELWFDGILIFDFFFYPDPDTLDTEPPKAEIIPNPIFMSTFVSFNFPCGHFGEWYKHGFFPAAESDTDIQECGKEELQNKSPASIAIDLLPIPEPGTHVMIVAGLVLMGLIARQGRFIY